MLQLIFRKVADVKREKELAEKGKNDPPLELASDHPVRKLISRFRKISDRNNADVEKGDRTANNLVARRGTMSGVARPQATDADGTIESAAQRDAANPASKWNKFLAGAAKATPNSIGNNNSLMKHSNDAPLATTALSGPAKLTPKGRWTKLMAGTQATIEETPEERVADAGKSNLGKSEAGEGAMARGDTTVSRSSETPLTQRDITVSVAGGGAMSTAEHYVVSTLADIRKEMRDELQTLNARVSQIDAQMSQLLRIFTSHPALSAVVAPSCASQSATSGGARNETGSARKARRAGGGEGGRALVSPATEHFRTVTPPSGAARKESPTSDADSAASGGSRAKQRKRKKSAGSNSRTRVAPSEEDGASSSGSTPLATTAATHRDDNDELHVKDMDLDIL